MNSCDHTVILGISIAVLTGCQPPGDSNGGEQWHLSDEPVVAIGVTEGAPEYQFHEITGVVRVADGGIAVADVGSQQVRIFDAMGRHVQTLGGAGDGPGEFRALASLDRFSGDSLLVFDSGNRRVSVFDLTEGFSRSWTVESLGRGLFPTHALALEDGSILIFHLRGNMPGDPPGLIRNAAPVIRVLNYGIPRTAGIRVSCDRSSGLRPGFATHLFLPTFQ